MAYSRQRAINYIMRGLSVCKARMAGWCHHRADGKLADADLYHMSYLQ